MRLSSSLIETEQFAKRPWLEYVYIADVILGQVMTLAGSTYTLSLLRVIEEYYGSSPDDRGWIMGSFAITVGSFITVCGRLGEVYGLKLMVIIGYSWICLWSILEAVSYWVTDVRFFFCCRAFQGLGCAILIPNVIASIGRTYKPDTPRIFMVLSLVGWAAPVGSLFGPFFAGLIAVKTKYWNWICWSYAMAALLGVFLTIFSFPCFELFPQPVDWIGCGLLICGLFLFSFVWNQAAPAGWDSPYIITLLVISVCLIIAFVTWELIWAENPVIPSRIIRKVRYFLCLNATFLCWGTFGVTMMDNYTINLFHRNYSPLGAGAATIAGVVSSGVASIVAAFIMRFIPVEFVFMIGMACFLGSALIIATVPVHQIYWRGSFGAYILGPFGMAFSFPSAMVILMDKLPLEKQGLCATLIMTAMNYGIAEFTGMATVVQKQIKTGGSDILPIRASQYLGVGLSGLAMFMALILFTFYKRIRPTASPSTSSPSPHSEEVPLHELKV